MSFSFLKKIPLFWKVWIIHIFTYYPISTLFNIPSYYYLYNDPVRGTLFHLVRSPIAGIAGFIDGFPFFIFFQIALMFLLYKTINKMFNAYVVTMIISQLVLFFTINLDKLSIHDMRETLFYILLSVIITVILNRIILRKSYQLKESNDETYDN